MSAEIPRWAGTDRVLLRGGNVYSPADPFATAMLVVGHDIAWIGSEGAALAMADGVDEVIDLDGALVTPAFVDAHGSMRERATAAEAGIAVLDVLSPQPATDEDLAVLLADAQQDPGPLVIGYRATREPIAPSRGWAGVVADADGDPAGVGELIRAATVAQTQVALRAGGPGGMAAAIEGLRLATQMVGQAAVAGIGHRIEAPSTLRSEDVAALGSLGVVVVLRPQQGEGFPGVRLAELAASGVPFALGSSRGQQPDPWGAIRAAVQHPDPMQRISARAAFAAHTRGGWRASRHSGIGTLVPGAPAHYVVWECGDLVVQAPDDRIQAWSTDPRSGTPGLPDLGPQGSPPRCLRTVVWGRRVDGAARSR